MRTVADAPAATARAGPAGWPRPVLVAATTLLAAGLCLYRLGSRSLWLDEGVSLGLVRRSAGDFLTAITRWEVNQSPYYVLFAGWYRLGESEATMRLLSVAFAVATVPVVYALGKRLFDEQVGLVAAVLLALNGMVVQWSQQLRAYSMVLFLTTLATWALVRAVDRPSTRSAVLYAVIAVLAVYSQFFALLVIGSHAATLLLVRPFPRRLAVVAAAIMAVPLARVAVFVLTVDSDPLQWIERPTGVSLLTGAGDLAGGGAEQLLVYAVVAGAGLLIAWRAVRADLRSAAAWRYTLPVGWLVLPLAVVIAVTYAGKPLFVPRYLIIVCPALALVAALALVRLPQRQVARVAGAALVFVSCLGIIGWYRADGREDWRGATYSMLAAADAGDTVVVQPFDAQPTVEYYGRRAGQAEPAPSSPTVGDPAPSDRLWQLDRRTSGPSAPLTEWSPRIGYVEWRDRNYVLVAEQDFRRVSLSLYERRPAAS